MVGNKVTCDKNIYFGISLLQLPTESVRVGVEISYVVPLNLLYVKLHVMCRIKKRWYLLAQGLNIYRVEIIKLLAPELFFFLNFSTRCI